MSSPEQDVETLLGSLRPVAAVDTDSTCPLCLESYPAYSHDEITDYVTAPSDRPLLSHCGHVFGRICIERHIRSGEPYSTRCPICRERWIEPSQPSPNIGDEFDDDSLIAVVAPSLRVRIVERSDRQGTVVWDNMRDVDDHFEDVLRTIDDDSDNYRLSGTVSLQALVELLQYMQAMHDLGDVDEEVLDCVLNVAQAVGGLRRKLDERIARSA